MAKVSKNQALTRGRPGVNGRYYQFPEINGGTTVAFATFSGEHGERTLGERARIYCILKGKAKFEINGKVVKAGEGDVVAIPAYCTYNLRPTGNSVDILLFMELLDFDRLPK